MDDELRAALTAIESRLNVIEGRLTRIEAKVDAVPVLLPSLRDRLAVLDAQVRQQSSVLGRLEDTISMDVLQRIRRLEETKG